LPQAPLLLSQRKKQPGLSVNNFDFASRAASAVLACMTNPFYPIDLLVTIRAFTRERIGNGGSEHETGRYPDQLH
jgi:hypothetical protein